MRKPLPLDHTCLLFALTTALLVAGCAPTRKDFHETLRAQALAAPQSGPEIIAAYQPWFGRPGHINVGYSSQDRVVLRRQMEQAKQLGITAFVVNWYGVRNSFEDRAYALMQEIAAEADFKIALMYDEVDDAGRATEATISDLEYAYDNYIGPNAKISTASYLRYQDRPVIFIFPKAGKTDWKRVREVVNQWPERPLIVYRDTSRSVEHFDGLYAWVNPGRDGWDAQGKNWGREYLEDFYEKMVTKHPDKLAVGAAWPGFDDSLASWTRNRRMDPRCGRTLADSLRLFRRYYGNGRHLPFLMIVTWNDYEEGTAIEKGLQKC
jgi:hypothetical protein